MSESKEPPSFPPLPPSAESQAATRRTFARALAVTQVVIIVLFTACTKYDPSLFEPAGDHHSERLYPHFQDVHVMIVVGFGFLMTFLRKYGFSSVGLNFLLASLVLQWHVLVGGFMEQLFAKAEHRTPFKYVTVDLEAALLADFAAAACLISFGALLGKTSPMQTVVVALVEVVFFAVNEQVAIRWGVSDVGGSLVVHLFGAYFGLAASYWLTPTSAQAAKDNAPSYRSDLLAMVGTLFLWAFWPSFNSALAGETSRQRVMVNTVLAMAGGCVSAYVGSGLSKRSGAFSMVDIQNATLAGGVGVGAAANMSLHPGGALLVGAIAGALSAFGYSAVSPLLETKLGLFDTCGVHNLHGMPAVFAGIVSAIATAATAGSGDHYGWSTAARDEVFAGMVEFKRSAGEQAGVQIGFGCFSFALACIGGCAAAALAKMSDGGVADGDVFHDSAFWDMPEGEVGGSVYGGSVHGRRPSVGGSNRGFRPDAGLSSSIRLGSKTQLANLAEEAPDETSPKTADAKAHGGAAARAMAMTQSHSVSFGDVANAV